MSISNHNNVPVALKNITDIRLIMVGFLIWSMLSVAVTTMVSASQDEVADQSPAGVYQVEPYLIGPNDVVSVSVFRQPELSQSARVGSDGSIVVPVLGKVVIGGKSEYDAGKILEASFREKQVVNNPSVVVQVQQFLSSRVSVLGYVVAPGSYTLDRTTRLSTILGLAGGATPESADELLFTDYDPYTGAKQRYSVKIDDLLSGQNLDEDYVVGGGDVVYVPREKYFYIYGEVRSPGRYRYTEGMTLEQGLVLAGGTTELGSRGGIKRREDDKGKSKLRGVDLTELIKVGDIFYVPQRLF